jgi:RHS repeat-associated protein
VRRYNTAPMGRGLLTLVLALCGPPILCAQQMAVEFYHLDAQGNMLAVTDWNAAVVESHDYDVFGQEVNPQPGTQPKRFAGKERDTETGWDYFGARYYSSRVGRFTTTDPAYVLQENLLDPQRWNRYAYARNNPLKYTDPDGRLIDTIADVGFIGWDVFDMGRSAYRGEGISGTQWLALGGDVLGAAIPFATGVGVAIRAGAKVEHAVDAGRAAEGGVELVQRAMSRAELKATEATGLVRGGREGTHYASDAVNSSAQRARQRLALPQTPEVRATLEVPAGRFSPPSKVAPKHGMPGGGTERAATGPVPAKVVRADEMRK